MKRIYFIQSIFFLFLLLGATTSCQDNEEILSGGNGISEQNWTENQTFHINTKQTFTLTFTTKSSWTVQNSSTALLSLSTNAGNAGKNTLKVTAHQSSQRSGSIKIQVNGYSSNSTIKFELSEGDTKDPSINYLVDEYLKTYYLWNTEYKTLTPDFALEYKDFLNNTLMSMKGNTLDKKKDKEKDYLFSLIRKLDPSLQSTRSAKAPKTQEYSFGFINFVSVGYRTSSDKQLIAQGIYPGSSADKMGIKRGIAITHVDNVAITEGNIDKYYGYLVYPTSTYKVILKDESGKTYSLSSDPIYVNPVIHSQVKTTGVHKIGYLAYSSFEASFDEELFSVFKHFKNEGITDLVLDLRYNRGGHVMSANLISSCIAGSSCDGKTFSAYRYNEERMRVLNNIRPTDKFAYPKYENLNNISLSNGALNLPRVYCLVTENSASASELVINALRGINIDVVLIGKTTHGKNVGMEGQILTTPTAKYEFLPITFQSYNAKGFGDYENGFTPTHVLDENSPRGGYFEGYKDFGTDSEILYAKAVSLITGENVSERSSATRSSDLIMSTISPRVDVRRIGMIK